MKFVTRNKHNKTTGLNVATVNDGFTQLGLTWRVERSGMFRHTLQVEHVEFFNKDEPLRFEQLLRSLYALRAGNYPPHAVISFKINLQVLDQLSAAGHLGVAHELHERLDEVDGVYGQLSGGLVFKAGWDAAPTTEFYYKSEDVEE